MLAEVDTVDAARVDHLRRGVVQHLVLVYVAEGDEVDARQIERLQVVHRVVTHAEQALCADPGAEQVRMAHHDRRQAGIERLGVHAELGAIQVDHCLVQLGDGVVLEFGLGQDGAAHGPGESDDLNLAGFRVDQVGADRSRDRDARDLERAKDLDAGGSSR